MYVYGFSLVSFLKAINLHGDLRLKPTLCKGNSYIKPCQLRLYNTTTASQQRGKTHPATSVLVMPLNNSMMRLQ